MRSFFFIAFLLLATVHVAGQEEWLNDHYFKADSLKQLLNDQSLTEKQRMTICHEVSKIYGIIELDSSIVYADKAIVLAQKLKEDEVLMHLYGASGLANTYKGNFDEGLVCFNRSTDLAVKLNDKKAACQFLGLSAFVYAKQGKFHTTIDYYLQFLNISENEGWKDNIVVALANLGEINRRLGNTEMAIQYLKQAEEKCAEFMLSSYTWRMSQIYNEYAFIYLHSGHDDEALHYALKADSINNTEGTVNRCYTKGILASICLHRNDYLQALHYAKETYQQADVLGDINLYAYAGQILSDVYLKLNRYREAEEEAIKVWVADSTNIDESRVVVKNIALANIYMNHTEKAAYYLRKYSELNEQYSTKSFQTTVSDLSIKYEIEKKETRIASLEKERRLYVWLGIAGGLLTIAISLALWQKLRNERKEKQLIATRSILDGEMKERTRLAHDLHDRLSGNLSALKIELGKREEILQTVREQLDKCICDIRDAAHDLMPASLQYGMKVALKDFAAKFSHVNFHFFGNEKRVGDRLEYVVYCCANELVHNAVKHSDAKNINLQLIQDKKRVVLTVSDDGKGFNEKTDTKGMGLKSILNRVESCNGKMDIDTSPGKGTEVTIELKIKNESK